MKIAKCTIILLFSILSVSQAQRNDYLVGDTIIPRKELRNSNLSDIVLTHYAILAKHGYEFESNFLKKFFSRFSWYQPDASFSYQKLTRADRENIKSIIPIERSKRNKMIFRLTHPSPDDSIVFYKQVVYNDFFPEHLISEMDGFAKEKCEGNIRVPNFFSINPKEKLEKEYVDEKEKNVNLGEENEFSYWQLTYRKNQNLKSIQQYHSDYISGNHRGVKYYFYHNRLVYVHSKDDQTGLTYSWFIQYIKEEPAWITFKIRNFETNKLSSRKFYF